MLSSRIFAALQSNLFDFMFRERGSAAQNKTKYKYWIVHLVGNIIKSFLSVRLDKFNSNEANRVLFNGLSMNDTDYIDQVLGGDQHRRIQIGAKSDINAIKQYGIAVHCICE